MKRPARSKLFRLRCSEDELATLSRAADAEGVTPTAFARRAILGALETATVAPQMPRDANDQSVVRHFRLGAKDDQALQEGAARYRASISAFVRRAIRSAVSQRPLMSLAELETMNGAIEQFRRAAQNLNSLLRQVYLHQSGVLDQGPNADEFRFLASDLQTAANGLRQKLRDMPWAEV